MNPVPKARDRSAEYAARRTPDGRAKQRKAAAAWRAKNRIKMREYFREYVRKQRLNSEVRERHAAEERARRASPEGAARHRASVHAFNKRNPEKCADHNMNRKARVKAARRAPVRRLEIFERDDWRCGICGEMIDRGARAPHHMAPTIDHVLPLAMGGTHEPGNVQCAHFICNVRKGAR